MCLRVVIFIVSLWVFPELGMAQDTYVTIKTNLGNVSVRLYNETPEHRREFLKLVNSNHFDGTNLIWFVCGRRIQILLML
jgi:hypothetical protein